MLTGYQGTDLDQKIQAHDHVPDFQVLLFSRWADSDSDIIRGVYRQTPVDLTTYVLSGSVSLDMQSDAGSLNLTVSLERFPIGIFYNCIVQLKEGDARIPQDEWPTTFTGWHTGQPSASEEIQDKITTPSESKTERGNERTVSIDFISRDAQYTEQELTSDGVWMPNQTPNPDPNNYSFRDNYDDLGNIAKEFATNAEWGMGLESDEVLIGPLPYRIEKQLQIVQQSGMEALKVIGEVLHLVPQFNGEGKLRYVSRRIDTPVVRSYSGMQISSIPLGSGAFDSLNAVKAIGLDKDISDVVKAEQRLFAVQATFGFFDPEMTFSGKWGGDEQESYRVKVGEVVDARGKTVTSPTIKNFLEEGFIPTVSPPEFTKKTEFKYAIKVENDTALTVAALAAFFAGYLGLINLKTNEQNEQAIKEDVWKSLLAVHTHGPPPSAPAGGLTAPPTETPSTATVTALDLAAQALLLGGMFVLQQIGNYEFEVHGVPFETVYKELRVDAVLEHFGSQIPGTSVFRQWEKREKEVKNYIFSSKSDSVVPEIIPTHPEVVNPGLRTFAQRELSILLTEQSSRDLTMKRDILLEPGDVFEDSETGFKYKVKSVSRELARGTEPMMSVSVYRVA